MKIFRFENALFFVSVDHFRNSLFKSTTNPKQLHKDIHIATLKLQKSKAEASEGQEASEVSCSSHYLINFKYRQLLRVLGINSLINFKILSSDNVHIKICI